MATLNQLETALRISIENKDFGDFENSFPTMASRDLGKDGFNMETINSVCLTNISKAAVLFDYNEEPKEGWITLHPTDLINGLFDAMRVMNRGKKLWKYIYAHGYPVKKIKVCGCDVILEINSKEVEESERL